MSLTLGANERTSLGMNVSHEPRHSILPPVDFPHRTPPKRPVSNSACVGHLGVLTLACRRRSAADSLRSSCRAGAIDERSVGAWRLLLIEVAPTEARRLNGRLRFVCMPTTASLKDFDFDNDTGEVAPKSGQWLRGHGGRVQSPLERLNS